MQSVSAKRNIDSGGVGMEKKLADFFCDPKTALKNVFLFLLMIFLVVYAGFQILPSFAQKIETQSALSVSVFDTNKTNGYIFRYEEPIGADAGGTPVTFVKDGERVSKGQHFANIYAASDYAELQEEIDTIDAKIDILQKSAVETNVYVTDISKTDAEINKHLGSVYSAVADGNLSNVRDDQNDMLVSMNKRNMIVDMTESYTNELNSLKAQKAVLESRIDTVSRKLIADTAGYYYGDTDGYENIFDPDVLDELTLEGFEQLTSVQPDTFLKNGSYGKIITSFVWYVVCEAEKSNTSGYTEGYYYNLNFPEFGEENLTMQLKKIIKTTTSDKALLVFRGNTAPEEFTYKRNQQVDIISEKYSGLAIPKGALRIVDGEQGVYILNGDIVRFRRVNIFFENDDYYIVSVRDPREEAVSDEEEPSEQGKYPYIELYDSVIVKGKNLFDGKIVG